MSKHSRNMNCAKCGKAITEYFVNEKTRTRACLSCSSKYWWSEIEEFRKKDEEATC